MELLGYIALALMGITLGFMGAGGSILTIPILIYLFKVPITLATNYSLVIVGSTTFIATLRHRNHILFGRGIAFLIPSILGVFTSRHFIIPTLPHSIYSISIDKALVILLLIFMSAAGYFMIKNTPPKTKNHLPQNQNIKVILIGLFFGVIMGLLGAGGGFLIIPTLVLLMDFNIKEAIHTSLFIITVNSVVGFAADQHHLMANDLKNLAKYLAPAFFGMLIGLYVAKFIQGENLKKAFGYFIWIVEIAIIIKEFIL